MSAAHPLLGRAPARAVPALSVLPDLPDVRLPLGRVHEICGLARARFAIWAARQTSGPLIWIAPDWARSTLAPGAISHLIDPARLLHVAPRRPEDILWSVEEILRAGVVELVVADLPGLPTLTQIRRMHLAAETGTREGAGCTPLGLLLTPDEGGAPGIETRWRLSPDHATQPGQWRLDRLRARTAPPAHWYLAQAARADLPHPSQAITPA